MHRGEVLSGCGHHLTRGLPTAREGDAIDIGGSGQRRAGHRATAIDHVERARGQAGFFHHRDHAQH